MPRSLSLGPWVLLGVSLNVLLVGMSITAGVFPPRITLALEVLMLDVNEQDAGGAAATHTTTRPPSMYLRLRSWVSFWFLSVILQAVLFILNLRVTVAKLDAKMNGCGSCVCAALSGAALELTSSGGDVAVQAIAIAVSSGTKEPAALFNAAAMHVKLTHAGADASADSMYLRVRTDEKDGLIRSAQIAANAMAAPSAGAPLVSFGHVRVGAMTVVLLDSNVDVASIEEANRAHELCIIKADNAAASWDSARGQARGEASTVSAVVTLAPGALLRMCVKGPAVAGCDDGSAALPSPGDNCGAIALLEALPGNTGTARALEAAALEAEFELAAASASPAVLILRVQAALESLSPQTTTLHPRAPLPPLQSLSHTLPHTTLRLGVVEAKAPAGAGELFRVLQAAATTLATDVKLQPTAEPFAAIVTVSIATLTAELALPSWPAPAETGAPSALRVEAETVTVATDARGMLSVAAVRGVRLLARHPAAASTTSAVSSWPAPAPCTAPLLEMRCVVLHFQHVRAGDSGSVSARAEALRFLGGEPLLAGALAATARVAAELNNSLTRLATTRTLASGLPQAPLPSMTVSVLSLRFDLSSGFSLGAADAVADVSAGSGVIIARVTSGWASVGRAEMRLGRTALAIAGNSTWLQVASASLAAYDANAAFDHGQRAAAAILRLRDIAAATFSIAFPSPLPQPPLPPPRTKQRPSVAAGKEAAAAASTKPRTATPHALFSQLDAIRANVAAPEAAEAALSRLGTGWVLRNTGASLVVRVDVLSMSATQTTSSRVVSLLALEASAYGLVLSVRPARAVRGTDVAASSTVVKLALADASARASAAGTGELLAAASREPPVGSAGSVQTGSGGGRAHAALPRAPMLTAQAALIEARDGSGGGGGPRRLLLNLTAQPLHAQVGALASEALAVLAARTNVGGGAGGGSAGGMSPPTSAAEKPCDLLVDARIAATHVLLTLPAANVRRLRVNLPQLDLRGARGLAALSAAAVAAYVREIARAPTGLAASVLAAFGSADDLAPTRAAAAAAVIVSVLKAAAEGSE